jgi:hypothetical protein
MAPTKLRYNVEAIFKISELFIYGDVFYISGFSGLVVSMLASAAGSNPAEAVGFFGRQRSSACLPSEGK